MRGIIVKVLIGLSIFTGFNFLMSENEVYASETDSVLVVDSELSNDISSNETVTNNVDGYEKYIIDEGGSTRFDLSSAQMNNEGYEMLEFGKIYNDLASTYGNSPAISQGGSGIVTLAGVTELANYGNWCGKGNRGTAAVDALDALCREHDKCYERTKDWGNRGCNRTFVYAIRRLRDRGFTSRIGTYGRIYAAAAEALFSKWM